MNTNTIKIVSWNVNSIRARLARVTAWLQKHNPDVLCIQESKVEDAKFPKEEFEKLGYHCEIYGQKAYNGVAILSKKPVTDIVKGFPDDGEAGHRRFLSGVAGGIRIINVYVPNGESVESEKFVFKRAWLKKLTELLKTSFDTSQPMILLGDFNIAPEDRDVHDPARWRGKVLFHPDEHAALAEICKLGFRDALRLKYQDSGLYTWWDFRTMGFQRGYGLRIDLLLVTDSLAARCEDICIDVEERAGAQPSDHAPVIGIFREK
ncbi:MAG: exodeoxyribonuclease III [Planctomycetota bacterium]